MLSPILQKFDVSMLDKPHEKRRPRPYTLDIVPGRDYTNDVSNSITYQ